jgi:hypothetical protein
MVRLLDACGEAQTGPGCQLLHASERLVHAGGMLERHSCGIELHAERGQALFLPGHLLKKPLDVEHMFEYTGREKAVKRKGKNLKNIT